MNQFIQKLHSRHLESSTSFPDKEMACKFIDGFFEFLFIPDQLTAQLQAILDEIPHGIQRHFFA